MTEAPSPARWTVDLLAERIRGTLNEAMGYEALELSEGRCVGRVPFGPAVLQGGGIVHTGAMVAIADATATWAALTITDPEATRDPSRFPLAIQVSANVLRNTDHGAITATAEVTHRGRTTQVVQTEVTDEDGRVLARVTTTHLTLARG